MKKAFTLIELLVVIAIIAILAAILFPVFAQAKLAAKKTVSLSNQKQIGLGIILYTNDYDDTYPREDGCTLNDSMNPAFDSYPAGTDPTPFCNGKGDPSTHLGKYAFRDNHYSWQKWIQPYVKNKPMFLDPVVQYSPYGWNTDGEIDGGYAINLALTGALNTWPKTSKWGIRNSFLGGTATAVPGPADAMLMMDQITYSVVGGYEGGTTSSHYQLTYYPIAAKEHWEGYFYQPGGTGFCGEQDGVIDTTAVPYSGQVPLSYCDGHTKTIPVGGFLANTPSAAEVGLTPTSYICGVAAAYYSSGTFTMPAKPYPMWALN